MALGRQLQEATEQLAANVQQKNDTSLLDPTSQLPSRDAAMRQLLQCSYEKTIREHMKVHERSMRKL